MYEIIFFILIPFIALLYEGLQRKLNARLQNRIGPPILQPFYDIKKLFSKKSYKSQNDPFFKIAPFLYFVTIYSLFLFIPFSLIQFEYDFVFLIYLTILASAFYVLSGLSSDNPFGIIGSMREMTLMIVYEITIAIIIFNFIMTAGVLSLANFQSTLMFLVLPISSIALAAIFFVELHITPFDTSEAPPEIISGAPTEYSGNRLAFMEMAKYMKRLFFVFLMPLLLFGRDILIIFLFSLIFLFVYTLIQVITPRYRLDQAFKVYFVIMFFVLLEFVIMGLI
ncbi:MAG: respiratory chain complex I subunit 1 family protein [Candidatus Aenigmatarchaeota archaeon]